MLLRLAGGSKAFGGGTAVRHLGLSGPKGELLSLTRPRVPLLDGGRSGLNPSEVREGLALIRRIRDSGVTVVIVEHLVQAVFAVCDRVAVMSAGEKIADGAPAAPG